MALTGPPTPAAGSPARASARPVLVTGAEGFAGSHLLDILETEGRPVVAWQRPGAPRPASPTGRRCRWMEVDVLDRVAVRQAVEVVRPSTVYHMAGAAHAGLSWDRITPTLRVNVLGTHTLLSALADTVQHCRVLVPGSALVYRPQERALREDDELAPGSPYGLSKLAQEMTAAQASSESELEVVITRSFNHIGPRQDPSFFAASFARQVALVEAGRTDPVVRVGNLEARRDLTDVRDTVRAYHELVRAGRAGRVYNVCCGRAHRVGDILDGLLVRSTVRIEVQIDPGRYRRQDAGLVLGDHERITAETGWTPAIPLDRTLDDLLGYWRARVRSEPPA